MGPLSIEISLIFTGFALSLVTLHGNLLLLAERESCLRDCLIYMITMAGCTFPPKPMLFPPNFNTQRRAKVLP